MRPKTNTALTKEADPLPEQEATAAADTVIKTVQAEEAVIAAAVAGVAATIDEKEEEAGSVKAEVSIPWTDAT